MCLIYRRSNGSAFVRLCALTSRQGEHQELTPDQARDWRWGDLHETFPRRRNQRSPAPQITTVTFDTNNSPEVVIVDMARYMQALHDTDADTNHVTFTNKHGISSHSIQRAISFGWSQIMPPPEKECSS